MHLRKIEIENIRSLSKVEWEIEGQQAAGWHVILGDNGAGKSSFLRSVALALVGPFEAPSLRQNWQEWLRFGTKRGYVELTATPDREWDDMRKSTETDIIVSIELNTITLRPQYTEKSMVSSMFIWGDNDGWFSASYGPYRRFSGTGKDAESIFSSNPGLAPHLSVFGEDFALAEGLRWLQDLRFKQLEKKAEGQLLDQVRTFINQPEFLPHNVHLEEVSSEDVTFRDANNNLVRVEELSDGYRSMLSMTFELIRQLAHAYGAGKVFSPNDSTKILAPGVVLIDEVDAHLHPSWQRRIGFWFREHFPNIQFIVTTHSPLICQAADEGTIFRLPRPGSDEVGSMVTGIERDRLLKGNILEAYDTPAFGVGLTRSDESKRELEELAKLNVLELTKSLSASQQEKQQHLRAALPTTANNLKTEKE